MKRFLSILLFLPTFAFAQAQVDIQESGCSIPIPSDTPSGEPFLGFVPGSYHSVVTPSGLTKLTCKGEHGFPIESANSADGFFCNTFLGLTTVSKAVATPSGKTTLQCFVK